MKILKSFLVLLSCGLLCGCGSSYSSESNAGMATNSIAMDSMYVDDYVVEDYSDVYEEPTEAEIDGFTKEDATKYTEKLVYSANLTLETTNYDESVTKLKDICTLMDCFVESEQMHSTNKSWTSGDDVVDAYTLDICVRVPSDVFDSFVDSMDVCGKVINKSISATNITQEYYDIQSVIDSLEVQESRLLDMMDKAYTVEDMISIENRLTDVQTRINQYKTRIGVMDMQVSYSTVNITVDTVQILSGDPDDTSTFFARLGIAIRDTIDGTLDFLEKALFFLVRSIPVIVFAGISLFVYWKCDKIFNKKNKGKGEVVDEEDDREDQ